MGLLSSLLGKKKNETKPQKRAVTASKTNQVKKNNKEWSKLNQDLTKKAQNKEVYDREAGSIRLKQADILRREGKYVDSILMVALGFLTNNYKYGDMNKSAFIKRISSSAEKAGLKKADVNHIADILNSYVKSNNGSEAALTKDIKAYIMKAKKS